MIDVHLTGRCGQGEFKIILLKWETHKQSVDYIRFVFVCLYLYQCYTIHDPLKWPLLKKSQATSIPSKEFIYNLNPKLINKRTF